MLCGSCLPTRYISCSPTSSCTNLTIECLETTATASLSDLISSVTSFHHSHSICSVRSLETPFSCFIFCRTASLCTAAILHTFHYLTCHSCRREVGRATNATKYFVKRGLSATCHLSLPHQLVTCHNSCFTQQAPFHHVHFTGVLIMLSYEMWKHAVWCQATKQCCVHNTVW